MIGERKSHMLACKCTLDSVIILCHSFLGIKRFTVLLFTCIMVQKEVQISKSIVISTVSSGKKTTLVSSKATLDKLRTVFPRNLQCLTSQNESSVTPPIPKIG